MNRNLKCVWALAAAPCALTAFADGLRESELVVATPLQDVVVVQDADLRNCWVVKGDSPRIELPYSAVGWGPEPLSSPASVRLNQQDGSFVNGAFVPGVNSRNLATGLSGSGVYVWTPGEDATGAYRILHEATRSGQVLLSETFAAYFDFTAWRQMPAESRSAVLGFTQPIECGYYADAPWSLVDGAGDGLRNEEDGAALSFAFSHCGVLRFEYALEGGVLELWSGDERIGVLGATDGWTVHSMSFPTDDRHELELRYVADGGGVVRVRNVCWDIGDSAFRADVVRAGVAVDLQEGVRTPPYLSDVLPFTYSSVHWIGDVSGATAASVSKVEIVQLTGTDPDVRKWTEEVPGTRLELVKKAGEGEIKWNPSKGVWKVTFEIKNGDGTVKTEDAVLDLRKSRTRGMFLFLT